MKKYPLIAIAVASALLAAGSAQAADAAKPAGDPIAIVNGKPISKAAFESVQAELARRPGGGSAPDDKIVEELIKREVLAQEAESQGLDKDPKFAARIENARRLAMAQNAVEHYMATLQVGDDELKKEYDQRIGANKATEFKARHILVDSEKTAKEVLAKLDKGGKFADLAKKYSKDPGSKDKGGDLGWFNPQQMVPQFSEAVTALKNGETTKAPVQSQFGWHIIQREESREQAPPPFDAVKDQLRNMLQSQKLQQHMAELESKAKIENRLPPKPAEPPAPPAGAAAPGLEAGKPQPPAEKPAQPAPAAPAPAPKPAH
ncbi:peptidylprolyl isomerase [Methylomagnum ishizawai]|uniref:peptidylprolyl isomerase n=1 Tax=Methylomagnum ishizawai TaxID=1760988 RepID=UPI001C335577|nr:peptidylprolyl isomerase [Methylomagnum ishizawai]BBL75949.1 peptidylprolyl isomerase [Methylomagnum ishizawai]